MPMRTRQICVAAALCVTVLMSASCGKKKAPPPPPVKANVTPPPITTFDLATVAQSSSADNRVKVAGEQKVFDEAFAQATVKLASALANGDERQMRTLLEREDGGTLGQLVDTDEWAMATENIEQVRILLVNEGGVPGAPLPTTFDGTQKFPNGGVLFAVQEPGSSYLLGWAAYNEGGTWKFSGYGTIAEQRARASDWDEIGQNAFVHASSAGASVDSLLDSIPQDLLDQIPEEVKEQLRNNPPTTSVPSPGGPIQVPTGPAPGEG